MQQLFIYWIIYAFFGWIVETLYTSIPKGSFQERGFLFGPIIPIYGFGALMILYLLNPFFDNIFLVFILGIIATSILEYITSYIMEKIFHMRWWDYSNRKFNIQGRICLRNSVLFGILSVVLVEFIHPKVSQFIINIPPEYFGITSTILFILVMIDTLNSIVYSLNLSKIKLEIDKISEEIIRSKEVIKQETRKSLEEIKVSIGSLEHHIIKAYPNLKNNLRKRLEEVKTLIEKNEEN